MLIEQFNTCVWFDNYDTRNDSGAWVCELGLSVDSPDTYNALDDKHTIDGFINRWLNKIDE